MGDSIACARRAESPTHVLELDQVVARPAKFAALRNAD
jgi:hypothetical protein